MRVVFLISFILLLFFSTGVNADTYLPLDSKLYWDLRYLEAVGGITTSQLATLPISRREGSRLTSEALANAALNRSPRVEAALARLQREFQSELDADDSFRLTLDTADLQYGHSDEEGFFAQKNRDGVEVRRGNNVSLSVTGRFDSKYLGGVVKPEVDLYDDAADLKLKKGYLLANLGREEFMFGKESGWWGPGLNGATLLSTNAEPLTSFKISNSVPYFPFDIGLRGTFFITRLEHDRRDVRSPILYGIRFDVKPVPAFELGLTKTAIFGGEGRSEDLETFGRSLFGLGENDTSSGNNDPGDQRAGIDVKVVLPWQLQPVTLTAEMTGEDQRNNFPAKWFGIYGIYLPRVLGLDRLELWAEYAYNTDSHYRGAWYTHHIYTQGYTYNGRIIGHYMGADARDLFLQGRYHFDPLVLTLSYERLHKVYPERFTWENFQATSLAEVSHNTDLFISAEYANEMDKNMTLQVGLRRYFL